MGYYRDLFTTSQPREFDDVLMGVGQVVTSAMNS